MNLPLNLGSSTIHGVMSHGLTSCPGVHEAEWNITSPVVHASSHLAHKACEIGQRMRLTT